MNFFDLLRRDNFNQDRIGSLRSQSNFAYRAISSTKRDFIASAKANEQVHSTTTSNIANDSASVRPIVTIKENQAPEALTIGKCDYKLKFFKKGGICEIYQGFPESKEHPTIAIKMIRPEWFHNSRVRKQFSTESQIVRGLNGQGFPQYLSRGLIDGKPYFAYRFMEGVPLISLSQQQHIFPPSIIKEASLDIICQLLAALDNLHTKLNPVAHGDISSENIIFDDWHNIHLIDFGCAHFLKMTNNESHQWVGKPSFISPEQARGETWDHRSDIYQAGILFYELIKARRWNIGKDARNKTLFAASALSPDENFLARDVGKAISRVIAKMLQPDPRLRYQSAREVLNALESFN